MIRPVGLHPRTLASVSSVHYSVVYSVVGVAVQSCVSCKCVSTYLSCWCMTSALTG